MNAAQRFRVLRGGRASIGQFSNDSGGDLGGGVSGSGWEEGSAGSDLGAPSNLNDEGDGGGIVDDSGGSSFLNPTGSSSTSTFSGGGGGSSSPLGPSSNPSGPSADGSTSSTPWGYIALAVAGGGLLLWALTKKPRAKNPRRRPRRRS